jgi:hypothetical protein
MSQCPNFSAAAFRPSAATIPTSKWWRSAGRPLQFRARLAALGCLLFLFAGFTGCGKSEGNLPKASDEGLPPEAVAVRKAFASAPPSHRGPVEESLRLLKGESVNRTAWAEALPQLQTLATNPTVSPEQRNALEKLIQRVKDDLSRRT